MNRPSSHRTRTYSLETLEPRQMLSGIPQWDDVPLERKDVTAAVAAVMRGTGEYPIAVSDIPSLQEQMRNNDDFRPLTQAAGGFLREQSELRTAEAKTQLLQSHIGEESTLKDRLGEDLTLKRTLLTEAQTLLQSCRVTESELSAEQQRLETLVTTLQEELRQIPGQITALNQQIAKDQKTLSTTITQHKQTEKTLVTLRNSYDRTVQTHDRFAALLVRYPQNKTYQFQHVLAHRNMANLEPRIKTFLNTITNCSIKEDGLNASLLANRTEVSRLKERYPAIPAEIQSAQDRNTATQAELTGNRAEQARLQTEIAGRQSAVDAIFAEESRTSAHLQQDIIDLAEFTTLETSESADVQAMYEAVNIAIAQVLAEGDPALPDIDPDPVVIPQKKTDAPALGTAVRENEWTKLSLPTIGGEVLLRSWQGEATGSVSVETVTGDAIRHTVIAASLTTDTVNQTPTLANELDLVAGVQPDPVMGFSIDLTRNVEGIGNVFVRTDKIVPYYPGKPLERFIVSTQGTVASSSVAYIGPTLTLLDPGKGKVEVAFTDGPQYLQWIDVRHLGGETGGVITIKRPDGSSGQIPFSSDGPVIVDDTVMSLVMQPNGGAGYGIKSLQCAEPQVDADPAATWLQSRGELVGIDVSRAGKAVDQVSLHVLSDRPSSPLTAVAYRGNVKIASMNVGPDGLIDLAASQGITSVLCIQFDPN
ncbi:MAG: hypothetical protein PHE68_04495, partial [Candidatus Peribacteraceae bacterium]|nr:hypothetical protein [Candidatus Peribacteraceae bacterium]